jgi:AcrR family transcriptional regulator
METFDEKKIDSPYHHGDLSRALVDAATELVTCCGPASVSLREIARMVGVSHNAPYRHFPTREALLAAVAARGFEMLFEGMSKIEDDAAPDQQLSACCRGYVDFAVKHPGVYQLMFSAEIQRSAYPALSAIGERAFQSLERRVMALNPKVPAVLATLNVWAMVHGIAHLILDNQLKRHVEDPDHQWLVEVASRILAAGVIHAPPLAPEDAELVQVRMKSH